MLYQISKDKKEFSPIVVKMTIVNGRELANFCRAMTAFGKEYKDDYDINCFEMLAETLSEIKREKLESGEMISVE
jgi:hypothetical protein